MFSANRPERASRAWSTRCRLDWTPTSWLGGRLRNRANSSSILRSAARCRSRAAHERRRRRPPVAPSDATRLPSSSSSRRRARARASVGTSGGRRPGPAPVRPTSNWATPACPASNWPAGIARPGARRRMDGCRVRTPGRIPTRTRARPAVPASDSAPRSRPTPRGWSSRASTVRRSRMTSSGVFTGPSQDEQLGGHPTRDRGEEVRCDRGPHRGPCRAEPGALLQRRLGRGHPGVLAGPLGPARDDQRRRTGSDSGEAAGQDIEPVPVPAVLAAVGDGEGAQHGRSRFELPRRVDGRGGGRLDDLLADPLTRTMADPGPQLVEPCGRQHRGHYRPLVRGRANRCDRHSLEVGHHVAQPRSRSAPPGLRATQGQLLVQ